MTIPMMFGILSMVVFNLTDTFFVSRLGTNALAAMSFTFPVIFVIHSIAMGLGVGVSAVVSRTIGRGDHDQVKRLTTDSLVLSLFVVGIFVAAGLVTIDPLFRALGATEQILPLIKDYMYVWYAGVLFVVIPMVGNSAIRATGDTKTPSIIMIVAMTVNLVLDPLLIFGIGPFPRMELAGAALATVIARASALVVSLWVLAFREKMLSLVQLPIRYHLRSWRSVLYIGLPTAGTNVIVPVAAGIIIRMVAEYGPEPVAALGVATRVDPFALAVIFALSASLGPFVGQNVGAARFDRVREAMWLSQKFAFVWGGAMLVLLAAAARPIASLFSDSPEVIDTAVRYFRLIPVGYGLQSVLLLSNTALNVLKKPLHAALLIIIQMFVLYIPLAYLGSRLIGVPGIFIAATTANCLAGVAAFLWLRRIINREEQLLKAPVLSGAYTGEELENMEIAEK
jgi:putative MATE family efflux protein